MGTLFSPASSGPRPAAVVLGGSEGGLLGEGVAATLARRGYAALAYFGTRSLPSELVEIPLEYFAGALRWLRSRPETDGDRVALMGGSKGGELALLLGGTYPEDIRAVVGYVPSAVVYQGVSVDPWYYVRGVRSSWTYRGDPVPFVDASPGPFDSVRWTTLPLPAWPFFGVWPTPNYPVAFKRAYERPLEGNGRALAAAAIPVEKIGGPVLLVSGTDDQIWPAAPLGDGRRAPAGQPPPVRLRAPPLRRRRAHDPSPRPRTLPHAPVPRDGRHVRGGPPRNRRLGQKGPRLPRRAPHVDDGARNRLAKGSTSR